MWACKSSTISTCVHGQREKKPDFVFKRPMAFQGRGITYRKNEEKCVCDQNFQPSSDAINNASEVQMDICNNNAKGMCMLHKRPHFVKIKKKSISGSI